MKDFVIGICSQCIVALRVRTFRASFYLYCFVILPWERKRGLGGGLENTSNFLIIVT